MKETKKQATKGSIYTFGGYNWLVLDVQGEKALLLSEKVLEKRRYNESKVRISWEKSTLRQYLNSEFYDKFNCTEKAHIAETRVANKDSLWYGTDGGSDTMDKIFLLSIEEVVRYFGDSEKLHDSSSSHTYYIHDQYNLNQITKNLKGEACWWWLRSPGLNSNLATDVRGVGCLNLIVTYILNEPGGVRPALWINLCLENMEKTYEF